MARGCFRAGAGTPPAYVAATEEPETLLDNGRSRGSNTTPTHGGTDPDYLTARIDPQNGVLGETYLLRHNGTENLDAPPADEEDWPPVDAVEDADPLATEGRPSPDDDWAAMLAGQTPPAPAVRPLDPAVERLRIELDEIRRKRRGLPAPLFDEFEALGVAAGRRRAL
jgi:hypothetical protein